MQKHTLEVSRTDMRLSTCQHVVTLFEAQNEVKHRLCKLEVYSRYSSIQIRKEFEKMISDSKKNPWRIYKDIITPYTPIQYSLIHITRTAIFFSLYSL
jgi:hypothetical protein